MHTDKLSETDKKILFTNLSKSSLIFILIGLIMGLVFWGLHFLIMSLDLSKSNISNTLIFWIVLIVVILIYAFITYKKIRPSFLDLYKGEKIVRHEKLKEKQKSNAYGFHSNVVADSQNQPTLTEYYFLFDELKLLVEKDEYESFNEGDMISISIGQFTNKIIQMEKI